MKKLLKTALIEGLLLVLPIVLLAQEKTQSYYNTHESEILPDAQEAFRDGNYERTIQLCIWQYVIVGDRAAEALREKAEQCARLSNEMAELQATGDLTTAIEKANAILAINPDDPAAKALSLSEIPAPTPVLDTVAVTPPVEDIGPTEVIESNPPVKEEEPKEEIVTEPWPGWDNKPIEKEDVVPSKTEHRTRFVLKGGASILDLKQIDKATGLHAAIGLYDLGGSPFGFEIGYCPGLFASDASLYVAEAAIVLRAVKGIYPKIGVGGFYSSYPEKGENTTKGLCGVFGCSFLIGKNFCIEIGANYYPTINILGKETVNITGGSYDFPTKLEVISGGISPVIGIGVAF